MMHLRRRLLLAALAAAAASAGSLDVAAQTGQGPRVEISFSPSLRDGPITGMVYLAISRDNQRPPIEQVDPEGVPLFSRYVEQMNPGAAVTLTAADRGH